MWSSERCSGPGLGNVAKAGAQTQRHRTCVFLWVFFVKKNALFCEECADGCNSRRSGESSPAGLVSTVTRERPQPGPALSQA